MFAGLPMGALVVGVGIDVVAIERFEVALRRTPSLRRRLFAEAELLTPGGRERGSSSLAARFAAKEAVAKALGVPRGMEWHDCSVISEPSGRPLLSTRGTVLEQAQRLGISGWLLSLSHDGGIAAAVAIGLA